MFIFHRVIYFGAYLIGSFSSFNLCWYQWKYRWTNLPSYLRKRQKFQFGSKCLKWLRNISKIWKFHWTIREWISDILTEQWRDFETFDPNSRSRDNGHAVIQIKNVTKSWFNIVRATWNTFYARIRWICHVPSAFCDAKLSALKFIGAEILNIVS